MTGKQKQIINEDEQTILCETCGTLMIEEDGKKICPKCSTEIDYFGDEDEDI